MKLMNEDQQLLQEHGNGINLFSDQSLQGTTLPKVLFLVTVPPESIVATFPPYQNPHLPQLIREWGALVDIRSWRDESLDAAAVGKYDKITFLWCNDYHEHPKDFPRFVLTVLIPAQTMNPRLHIINDPKIVLWNSDKHYLLDLARAGYQVPETTFVDVDQLSRKKLLDIIAKSSGPLVLKPAISGSARNCHLIKVPKSLTADDLGFIDRILVNGTHGDLILQQYEPGITSGEWSLMFVNGIHTHTVLKVPQVGEFRINGEFGGRAREVPRRDVPQVAINVGYDVMMFLHGKIKDLDLAASDGSKKALVYARIDGVVREGRFVLMEVEVIEPHMWLEKENGYEAMEQLRRVFVPYKV